MTRKIILFLTCLFLTLPKVVFADTVSIVTKVEPSADDLAFSQSSTPPDGSILSECNLEQCVIGVRSMIRRGCTLERVVMMGADFYEAPGDLRSNRRKGLPNVGIGAGSTIRGAIIDKNARIGEKVRIENTRRLERSEGKGYAIRDGIVVIEKSAVIPDHTVI